MDDPNPDPRPARFQFSLRALMGWVLWFGLCVVVIMGIEGRERIVAIFCCFIGSINLYALFHEASGRARTPTSL